MNFSLLTECVFHINTVLTSGMTTESVNPLVSPSTEMGMSGAGFVHVYRLMWLRVFYRKHNKKNHVCILTVSATMASISSKIVLFTIATPSYRVKYVERVITSINCLDVRFTT